MCALVSEGDNLYKIKETKEFISFDKGAKLDSCFLNTVAHNEEVIR